jgi:ATP-dependent DNA helicase DinG
MELKRHFPMPEIRPEQEQILKKVAKALEDGKKYIIIEAPPGSGKSPIAITLCNYFGLGYICTDQKTLQDQYLSDSHFPTLRMTQMIGRSNFVCKQDSMQVKPGEEVYCDQGTCEKNDAFKCPGCLVVEEDSSIDDPRYAAISAKRGNLFWKPNVVKNPAIKCNYWLHKGKALNSEIVINNYSYLLLEGNYVGDFGTRPILISDEGHNIEKHIMNFVSVIISSKVLEAFDEDLDFPYIIDPERETLDQKNHPQELLMPMWIDWLRSIYMRTNFRVNELNAIKAFFVEANEVIYKKKDSQDKEGKDIKVLINKETGIECPFKVPKSFEGKSKDEIINGLISLVDSLESIFNTVAFFLGDYYENSKNWVIQPVQEGPKIIRGEFKPVRIDKYAKDKYFQFGEINVIMSATILDFERTAKNLGIKKGEYTIIKVPPVFPVESNKLYHLDICNLSHRNARPGTESYRVNMLAAVKVIDKILSKFPEQKGIIHCVTYPNMHFIKRNSIHPERILGHTPKNRGEVLQKHLISTEPLVLCSPSMSEGVNLEFDSSRFQIILKLPFPYTEDLQLKARIAPDQEPEYYDYKTALYLVQAIGRSVRAMDDWAYTFTVDTRFHWFCKKHARILENFNRYERPIEEGLEFLKAPPLKKEASNKEKSKKPDNN